MTQQDQQWEYCVLSRLNWQKQGSEADFDLLAYYGADPPSVKLEPGQAESVIRQLGLGGWEMAGVSSTNFRAPDLNNDLAMTHTLYFKRPVREGRAITEPALDI